MEKMQGYQHFFLVSPPSPLSSAGSKQDLRKGCWFHLQARPISCPRIDDSHCNRIHSSLTAVHCFDNGYVGRQPVTWKEYSVEYW